MESDSYADAPSNEACKMAINALRPVSREQVERVRDAAIEAANGLDKMIGRAWGED